MRYFLFFILLLFTINCKSKKSVVQNTIIEQKKPGFFDGKYQYKKDDCLLTINISNLVYEIKTQNLQHTGELEIEYHDKSILFQFKELYGEYPKRIITAEFINDTIVILNYGNAMNEFVRFSECDTKYIELKKV
ncbi:hypothetical protein [Aquimarina sp. Aq107]|uniref:hypothetical protein n=1 Tax=Aquimarina sp. Aq107 TaxID=1191912 RepID=UPI00131F0610|nr:hypothetical protein [Aquimarina sp. Aq107]